MFKKIWALSATRFLTSFNDNAFKMVAMFVAVEILKVRGIASGATEAAIQSNQAALVSFAAMMFMLPFVMFPTVAGWMADRYSKRKVLVWTKAAELGVMLFGLVSYLLLGTFGFYPLLTAVFLMALQSTFLSPAFYGILPETFDETEISGANGSIQLVNFLGIILGCACGAFVSKVPKAYFETPTVLVSVAICTPFIIASIIGIGTALCIEDVEVPKSSEKFGIHLVTNYFSDFKYVFLTRPIWLCVLGMAFFFSVGSLMMTSLMNYGMLILNLSSLQTSMLIVAIALGTGFGSFIAGEFSRGRVEFGLVPIGVLGMTVFCINLILTETFSFGLINCFALGIFSGFFVLPLTVYVQEKSPEDVLGKVLAQSNAVSFIGMLGVSVLMLVLTGGITGVSGADATFFDRVRMNFWTLDTRQLYIGAAVTLVCCSAYVFYLVPDFLLRLLVILLAKLIYRIRVFGLDNLPERGAVLLVANHVSYVDSLLISAASPRPVHFVVSDSRFKDGKWRAFAQWAQLISMPRDEDDIAIEQVHDLLKEGEAVCVFPEGQLTTNGLMGRFKRDFSRLLPSDQDVPIVPVHLGLLWGSIFSLYYGTFHLRRPRQLPYPVNVSFGKPMKADASPSDAKHAVVDLSVAAETQPGFGESILPEHFIRLAHRHPLVRLFADSTGKKASAMGMLVQGYAAAELIKDTCDDSHVGLMLPNSMTAVSFALGAMLADRSPVFLNFTASKQAIDFVVEHCEMTTILTSRAFLKKAGVEERDNMVFLEELKDKMTGGLKFRAACRAFLPSGYARRRFFPKHGCDVNSVATVLFSSGSTGLPKGIVLSHHNLTANINSVIRILGVQRNDVIMGTLPLFHSFGFLTALWLPLTWGLKVVWHTSPLDSEGIGKLTKEHSGTLLFASPTFLQAYTRKCEPEQFKSLRLVVTGAEKLSKKIADRFQKKFGIVPTEGYGATELSPVVAINVPENILDAGKEIGRDGSIGRPIGGINVKFVAPVTHDRLPDGEEGLMLIKGPNVMQGYLNAPEKTAEVIEDGWYVTGDMARMDEDGYLYITGRLSRFSKIGGEMVPHIAIEEAMHEALETQEQKLAVTSLEHPTRGERLVVLHLDLPLPVTDLLTILRDRGMPNLWIPKPNDFAEVDEIPILGSGKLDLRGLQEKAKSVFS